MKRLALNTLIAIASLAAGCQQVAHAASLPSLFWGAVVQNCIAQASDGGSTALAVSAGAHEINPFLVHTSGPHDGQLNLPRAIAFKAFMCGLPIAVRYGVGWRSNEKTGYAAGLTLAGPAAAVTQAVAIHNVQVWTAQKALNAAAAKAK